MHFSLKGAGFGWTQAFAFARWQGVLDQTKPRR